MGDKNCLPDWVVETIEDRNDNKMTFHYDENELLERVVDAVNRAFTFEYQMLPSGWFGESPKLTKVSGPDGIELTFTYNEDGLLESATRAGQVETYEYAQEPGIIGGDFNLVKTTDANNTPMNTSTRPEWGELQPGKLCEGPRIPGRGQERPIPGQHQSPS